ncbi:MAG: TIGR03067 domain-containing protein [Verrucomicrobia bacterium]|nr:TIGR03067 domain-containing protein [Verrucomicrobiota bacterium]
MSITFTKTVLFLAVTFLVAAHARAQSDAAERQKLAGTWEGWVVEGDGSQTSQRHMRVGEVIITAAQISAKDARSVSMGVGTYKLAAAGSTKTIDATGTGGPTQGKTYRGIYKLEGDTLKWCSGNDRAQSRPAEFKTNPGNGHFLMILTRKK